MRILNGTRYLTGKEVGELLGLDAEVIGFHRRRGVNPLSTAARKIGQGKEDSIYYSAGSIVWFILHELPNDPDSVFFNPSVHWTPNKRNKVLEQRLIGDDGYDALLDQLADPNDYAGEHDHFYPENIWDKWTPSSLASQEQIES